MKRRSLLVLLILLLVPGAAAAGDEAETLKDLGTYGEGVTLEESVPISAIHADPLEYVDTVVRVEGRIVDVCRKRGHWMELAGDEEFQSLRIEVEPGVIVFPADSTGRWAVVEGDLRKREYSLEETRHLAMHKAIEAGEEESFDPESVTEPLVLYVLEATGAVIRADRKPAAAPAPKG
jgi:hypothetical protein